MCELPRRVPNSYRTTALIGMENAARVEKIDLRTNKYDDTDDVKKERTQVEIDAGEVIMLSDLCSTEYPLWRHPNRCGSHSTGRNNDARITASSPSASSWETRYSQNPLSHNKGAAQAKTAEHHN